MNDDMWRARTWLTRHPDLAVAATVYATARDERCDMAERDGSLTQMEQCRRRLDLAWFPEIVALHPVPSASVMVAAVGSLDAVPPAVTAGAAVPAGAATRRDSHRLKPG